ncbi:MAG: hypothetical protein QJR11_06140 [Fulvimonas sp.]|nr:hypothetical protein [Fulvimonas sp.]
MERLSRWVNRRSVAALPYDGRFDTREATMHYDQSWMGYGWVGGVEAGLITALAAVLLYVLLRRAWRQHPGPAPAMGWAFLLAVLLTGSGDLWDMFYFNYAPLESPQLMRTKLMRVHDPDGIPLRVLGELGGAVLGVFAGWVLLDVARPRRRRTA